MKYIHIRLKSFIEANKTICFDGESTSLNHNVNLLDISKIFNFKGVQKIKKNHYEQKLFFHGYYAFANVLQVITFTYLGNY